VVDRFDRFERRGFRVVPPKIGKRNPQKSVVRSGGSGEIRSKLRFPIERFPDRYRGSA